MLIGLDIRVAGGTGIEVRPQYPAGELYRGEIRIHRGSVTIPVELRRTGKIEGVPRLSVTYQVCTDVLCLAPVTVVIPVSITGRQ